MKNYDQRTLMLANYILENKSTIRATAKYFKMAKSTVHFDLNKRLKKIDVNLYKKVKQLLIFNFNEKHIRGGTATKNMYKQKK